MIKPENMDCTSGCLRSRWAIQVDALLADTPTSAPNFDKLAALQLSIAMRPCATYCDRDQLMKETNKCS